MSAAARPSEGVGNRLDVTGSELIAGKNLTLDGREVSITAAENQSSQTRKVEQKTSGLTLALSGTVVSGEKVYSYCMSEIKIMAEKSGLKSLTLFEETTGRTLYWQAGTKGFHVKGANDE